MPVLLAWTLLSVSIVISMGDCCNVDYPANFSIVNCTMENGNLTWIMNMPLPTTYEGFDCTCKVSSLSNLSCEFRESTTLCTSISPLSVPSSPDYADLLSSSPQVSVPYVNGGWEIDYIVTHELVVQPECVVHNWDDGMTCSYALADPTNWTIVFSRCYGCVNNNLYKCPNQNGSVCWWTPNANTLTNRFFRGEYTMFLYNTFTRNVAVKSMLKFQTEDRVKLDAVSQLRYNLSEDNSMVLTWSSEKRERGRINYRVVRIKAGSNGMTNNTTNRSFSFGNLDLEPYTNYTIVVDCIPFSITKQNEVAGYWSESRTIFLRTNPVVPNKAPLVHGFHVMDSNQSIQVVQVYWQPIDETNGPTTSYRIRYRRNSSNFEKKFVAGSQCSVILDLDSDSDYVILIDARTSAGYNESLNLEEIFVKKRESNARPPEAFVVSSDGANKHFISFHESLTASNGTLFWCPSSRTSPSTCTGALMWQSISIEANVSTTVQLNTSDQVLVFVSLDSDASSSRGTTRSSLGSGMTRSSCVYNSMKEIETIDEFSFSEEQEPESLTLEWKKLDHCNNSAYISHYVLAYCESINCFHVCLDPEKPEKELKIDSHVSSYTIPGLDGGKCYRARIKGASVLKIGDHEGNFTTYQLNRVTSKPFLTPLEISSMVLGSSIFMILLAAVICMVRKVFTDIPIVPPQKSRSDDREEGSVTSSDNLISSAPRSPVDTGEPAASFIFSQHQDIGRTLGCQDIRTGGGQDTRTSGFQDSASSQTSGLATYSTVHQSTSDQDSEHALYTQTGYSSGTYDELRNLAFVSHSPARLPSFNGWNSGAADRSYSGSASTNGSVLDNSSILDLVINRN